MIKQPADKWTALRDKREWREIQKDAGYWQGFWQARSPEEKPVVANTVRQFMLRERA